MFFFGNAESTVSAARLARIERKLDLILESLDIEEPQDGLDEVRILIKEGKKIEAIKLYRELTGTGLRNAKEAVEAGL